MPISQPAPYSTMPQAKDSSAQYQLISCICKRFADDGYSWPLLCSDTQSGQSYDPDCIIEPFPTLEYFGCSVSVEHDPAFRGLTKTCQSLRSDSTSRGNQSYESSYDFTSTAVQRSRHNPSSEIQLESRQRDNLGHPLNYQDADTLCHQSSDTQRPHTPLNLEDRSKCARLGHYSPLERWKQEASVDGPWNEVRESGSLAFPVCNGLDTLSTKTDGGLKTRSRGGANRELGMD